MGAETDRAPMSERRLRTSILLPLERVRELAVILIFGIVRSAKSNKVSLRILAPFSRDKVPVEIVVVPVPPKPPFSFTMRLGVSLLKLPDRKMLV